MSGENSKVTEFILYSFKLFSWLAITSTIDLHLK